MASGTPATCHFLCSHSPFKQCNEFKSLPAVLKDNPVLASISDHGMPTITGMDIDRDSPSETEPLAANIAAAFNSDFLLAADSSAGLGQN